MTPFNHSYLHAPSCWAFESAVPTVWNTLPLSSVTLLMLPTSVPLPLLQGSSP